tara:strand:+ start:2812 stop:3120 length:309 start_codon:yes stop_codon:yes gene_type:complete
MYSDENIYQTTNKMTDTKGLFSMAGFSFKESPYRNKRAELIGEAVKDINSLRVGTKYKPLTDRLLAIKCNRNPFLVDDGELEYVLSQCKKKRNYSYLFCLLK